MDIVAVFLRRLLALTQEGWTGLCSLMLSHAESGVTVEVSLRITEGGILTDEAYHLWIASPAVGCREKSAKQMSPGEKTPFFCTPRHGHGSTRAPKSASCDGASSLTDRSSSFQWNFFTQPRPLSV